MKDLTNLFKALADGTRLKIIGLLLERELCVCEIVDILGMSQPRISRHLKILEQAGILHSWREGKWAHYTIEKEMPDYCKTLLSGAKEGLYQNKMVKIDLQKIKKVKRKMGQSCPRG